MDGEFFDRIDIRREDFICRRAVCLLFFVDPVETGAVETNDGAMKDEKTMKSGQ